MGQAKNYFNADWIRIRESLSHVNWPSELVGGFSDSIPTVNFSKILEASMDGCIPDYYTKRKKEKYIPNS